MPAGRTRPLLLECEAEVEGHSRRARLVTKARGLPEVHDFTLAHEYLGSRLARLVGIFAPEAHLVTISPQFVEVTAAELSALGLRLEAGLALGSEFVSDLLPFPMPVRLQTEAEAHEAAVVYTFDLLTQNPDRTIRNPNCGRRGERLFVWDFETAFSFRFALVKDMPWRVSHLPFCRGHVLAAALEGHEVDWSEVFSRFTRLPMSDIVEACSTIPSSWTEISSDVLAHLTAVLGHWAEFEQDVRASLEVVS